MPLCLCLALIYRFLIISTICRNDQIKQAAKKTFITHYLLFSRIVKFLFAYQIKYKIPCIFFKRNENEPSFKDLIKDTTKSALHMNKCTLDYTIKAGFIRYWRCIFSRAKTKTQCLYFTLSLWTNILIVITLFVLLKYVYIKFEFLVHTWKKIFGHKKPLDKKNTWT